MSSSRTTCPWSSTARCWTFLLKRGDDLQVSRAAISATNATADVAKALEIQRDDVLLKFDRSCMQTAGRGLHGELFHSRLFQFPCGEEDRFVGLPQFCHRDHTVRAAFSSGNQKEEHMRLRKTAKTSSSSCAILRHPQHGSFRRLKEVGERIGAEMNKLGFDEVRFDKMGNIMGRIGNGPSR
jgi:hypothetical protein